MTASKKNLELWRLEGFRRFMPGLPDGRLESTEEPDFIIHGEHRLVGVELTDLHRDTVPGEMPQQASQAMRNRVVARAKEIYTSRQHPSVDTTFFLDDRIHIKKSEVEPLATELADLVSLNIPDRNSTLNIPTDHDDMRQLPSILRKISVRRLDAVTTPFFRAPGATWVATLRVEDISRALHIKEQKYATYRIKCDEVWLVINVDTESMATWFELEPAILEETFTTPFDRVFLVQHFARKAHELRIHQGPPT